MSNYYAYLIRLWRENKDQPWRAVLVSPSSGQEHHFAAPELAYAFLQQQIHAEQTIIDGAAPKKEQ